MSNNHLADAAFLQVVSYDGEIFSNSKKNDIAFYCDAQQKFLLGPESQKEVRAPLTLAPHQVSVDVTCHIPELYGTHAHFSNVHTPLFTTDTFTFKNAHGRQLHIDDDLRVNAHAILENVSAKRLHASNLEISNTMHVDGTTAKAGFSNVTASNMETIDLASTRGAFSECTTEDMRCTNTLSSTSIKTPRLQVKDRCDVSSFIGFSRKKE